MPTVGSLFSGIGGMDLGLERAGWTVAFQVENDPFCQRVLAKHWPAVPRWSDIREVNPDDLPRVDLLAGGFPCQPVSVAGKRRGQDDARWLWPEFARLVRGLRPRLVLVENVPGLLVRGFGDVLGELAACGYDAEWQSLPAAAFGAPHIRERVFVLAYPRCVSSQPWREHGILAGSTGARARQASERQWVRDAADHRSAVVADTASDGWQQGRSSTQEGLRQPGCRSDTLADPDFQSLEVGGARRPIDHRHHWDAEPRVGRVADGVPHRVDRLRGLGNAVVPQVAEYIGRRLLETE